MLKKLKKLAKDELEFREREKKSKKILKSIIQKDTIYHGSLMDESLFSFRKGESYELTDKQLEYLKALYLINLAHYHQNDIIITQNKEIINYLENIYAHTRKV